MLAQIPLDLAAFEEAWRRVVERQGCGEVVVAPLVAGSELETRAEAAMADAFEEGAGRFVGGVLGDEAARERLAQDLGAGAPTQKQHPRSRYPIEK